MDLPSRVEVAGAGPCLPTSVVYRTAALVESMSSFFISPLKIYLFFICFQSRGGSTCFSVFIISYTFFYPSFVLKNWVLCVFTRQLTALICPSLVESRIALASNDNLSIVVQ